MKFYDREKEKALLLDIRHRAEENAQMLFVVGRRRVGKTLLLTTVYRGADTLYFFVARKTEALLCEEFMEEIRAKLSVSVFGTPVHFADIFSLLMKTARSQPLTVIIDEAQEFFSVNPSVYSDMQKIWDLNKAEAKINLVLCGSVYSLMTRIFQNAKEPLFGRATSRLHLEALPIDTLKAVLNDYAKKWTNEDLLALYALSGGVPKYIELFVERKALTLNKMLDTVFSSDSLFLDEGRTILIDEFG
jgi:AAA+ ATPase superfamily predicted ATPase